MINKDKFKNFINKNNTIFVISLLLLIFFLGVTSIYNKSLIYDERCYVGMGKYILETGNLKTDGSIYHASLSFYLNSLFLNFLKIDTLIWEKESCWDRGIDLIFNSGYDSKFITFIIRLSFILLSLLLGIYVYLFAKKLYGKNAGLVALSFYTFSPNILSMSGYAITDFPLICFTFITIYYFHDYINKPSINNFIIVSIMLALALLSKLTAIYLFLIFLILIIIKFRIKNLINNISKIFMISVLAFLIIFAVYGFQFDTISNVLPRHYYDAAKKEINKKFGTSILGNSINYVFDNVKLPAPTYFAMSGTVLFFNSQGEVGFLFENYSEPRQKWWYYYFVVFLIKTPVPLLILLLISIFYFKRIKHKNILNEFFLIVPIIILFGVFVFNQISFDIRHISTIYPFIFVFVSKTIRLLNYKKLFFLFFALVIWYLLNSILIFPHYTAFFNEFIGFENSYKYLVTGVDRGQDLIGLKNFMNNNNIRKINFSYHGSVDPKYYGINYDFMSTLCYAPFGPDYKQYSTRCGEEFVEDCRERKGYIAISTTSLQGRLLNNRSCYAWLKKYEPIKKIGYTIFVYNITG